MRFFLIAIFFLFTHFSGYSQIGHFTFDISGDSLAIGSSGEILIPAEGLLTNPSDVEVEILLIKESNQLPDGWASAMCTNQCAAPTTDTLYLSLDPGESQEYTMYFYTNSGPDTGFVLMQFTNLNDPAGNTIRQAYIGQTSISTSTSNLSNNDIQVYPNPSLDGVFIESEAVLDNRLRIWSITGQMIQEFRINSNPFWVPAYSFKGESLLLFQILDSEGRFSIHQVHVSKE